MNKTFHSIWYHEPWVWFNLALLTVAIIAAISMTVIAIRHTPTEIDLSQCSNRVVGELQQACVMKVIR